MKRLKFLAFLGLFFLLITPDVFAQAEVSFAGTIQFKDGDGGVFNSEESKTTITPSGNVVKTAHFQLPDGHFLIPKKGTNYLPVGLNYIDEYGEKHVLANYNIKVGKNGKFKVVLHLNGAGSIFPLGW